MIGHELEVDEARIRRRCLDTIEEELHDREARGRLQVERAIHELEAAGAAGVQRGHLCKKTFEREGDRRLVQGGKTELALERAAARGLDIEKALGDVLRREVTIRQHEVCEVGLLAGDDAHDRLRAVQDRPHQAREADVARTLDDIVGQPADLLSIRLVADFRPTDDDRQLRRKRLQAPNQLGRLDDVPDVDAEADDLRFIRQQPLRHLFRRPAGHQLHQPDAVLQVAGVGEQIAQPERGMRDSGR